MVGGKIFCQASRVKVGECGVFSLVAENYFSKPDQISLLNLHSPQGFYDSQITIKSTIITSTPIMRLYRIYNLAQLPDKIFSTSHRHIIVYVSSPRIFKLCAIGFPLSAIRSAASKSDVPVQPSTCHILVPEPSLPLMRGPWPGNGNPRYILGVSFIKRSRFVLFH